MLSFHPLVLILDPGICFGHQIIARALGGECVPNDGRWELGPTPLQLTDLGKRIFGSDELVSLPYTPFSSFIFFFITLRNAFRSLHSLFILPLSWSNLSPFRYNTTTVDLGMTHILTPKGNIPVAQFRSAPCSRPCPLG